jgi:hypothetical protein
MNIIEKPFMIYHSASSTWIIDIIFFMFFRCDRLRRLDDKKKADELPERSSVDGGRAVRLAGVSTYAVADWCNWVGASCCC